MFLVTNKEKLKKTIEEDFNSKKNYKQIIEKMDNIRKSNLLKWSLAPIVLLIIMSGFIFLNSLGSSKSFEKNQNSDIEKGEITSSTFSNKDLSKNEIDTETLNDVCIPYPFKVSENNDRKPFAIPSDLTQTKHYVVYTKDDKYTEIANYIMLITNGNNRNIEIRYSKDNEPVKDYYFSDEKTKITTINGVELKIYEYEENFYVMFKYNDYYFDIETSNLTEQEVYNYLRSILI